jgi:hypothetical protein
MKTIVVFVIVALTVTLAGALIIFLANNNNKKVPNPKPVSSFEECVQAGNPVQESYPRGCTANGKTFTEDIGNVLEKESLIRLEAPLPNQVVKSPLEIKGQAVGNWFFEASFPVKIVDSNGKVLGQIPAQTSADWMTEQFISFSTTLTFETPTTEKGKLILEKDNPSGLSENEDSLIVPIKFK